MSRGVLYMMFSTFVFSLMNLLIKFIPHIPAVEIVFFRSIISLVISFTILKAEGIYLWGNNKKVLILRGAFGAVSLLLYFKMIQEIPLASATVILFLSPIFTTILGIFIVNEKVKPLQWLFFLISFVGIIIVKGFDTRISILYLIMGILASIFSGLAYNCIRKLKSSEHPLVIIFYFPMVTLPLTGIAIFFLWKTPVGTDWFFLIAIGVLTQIAQYFMTRAYQAEELSKVVSLRYLGIIYALSFGYVFFDEQFGAMAYVGMIITLIGVILNVWYKTKVSTTKS